MSPVEHGEWPSRAGLDGDRQQIELLALLDRARDVGLNAIIFHVRTGADAMYPSSRVPWSAYLTGELGKAPVPAYDPVDFAVQEAHARGLQFHAWFNPFRVSPPMRDARRTAGHIATEHPKWVVRYGDQLWIDPGIPAARRAVLDDILEVVDKYDIDAVHLDDYFYPYLEERTITRRVRRHRRWHRITHTVTLAFADNTSWRRYGKAEGWTDRGDWRRANIDQFIQQLYREVKARKPWVQVGISPFGIWRPGYPEGVSGLDAYTEIYADSRRWLREGWVDYLAPQLYWPLAGAQDRFTRLDRWWRSQNPHDRHIWPGLFTMMATTGSERWPAGEIAAEVDTLRASSQRAGDAPGHVHFRLQSLLQDARGNIGDQLRRGVYRDAAIPPAFPWLGNTAPAAPKASPGTLPPEAIAHGVLGNIARKGAPVLDVQPGDSIPVRWWVLQVQGSDGRWSTVLRPGTERQLPLTTPDASEPRTAAVTALSRTGVAGPIVVVPLARD